MRAAPAPSGASLTAASPDGLPTGRCTGQKTGAVAVPAALAAQSMLALACVAWQRAVEPPLAASEDDGPTTILPIRKRAEQETDERWSWWGQLQRAIFGRQVDDASHLDPVRWEDKVVERSGVGAGTEPCFACQGRIANLGALTTATPDGDKRTFSVWRCRNCYTYYLNDWIDRWERTDSLETEEFYYRLMPAEALEILAVIDDVVDAEHPARRHERDVQRDWVSSFVGARAPLSHQVRQGRG